MCSCNHKEIDFEINRLRECCEAYRDRITKLQGLSPWLYHAPGCATNCHEPGCITPHACDCGLSDALTT